MNASGLLTFASAESLPVTVHAFLVRSERRVLEHCRSMLQRKGLADEERQTLLHLAAATQHKLARLEETERGL